MKAIGSSSMRLLFSEWSSVLGKGKRAILVMAGCVPAVFLASCAQTAGPSPSQAHGQNVAGGKSKHHIYTTTGHFCHTASLTPVVVGSYGYSTNKAIALTTSDQNTYAETRTVTLTYTLSTNSAVKFVFYANYDVGTNPSTYQVNVPVTIPAGNPGRYNITLETSVRFADDLVNPVYSQICVLVEGHRHGHGHHHGGKPKHR